MSWLAGLATASTLGSLVIALIYFDLYAWERRPRHLLWASGWVVYAFRDIAFGRALILGVPLPAGLGAVAALITTSLLLWAWAAWRGYRIPPWAAGATTLCLVALAIARWVPGTTLYVSVASGLWIVALRLAGAHLAYKSRTRRFLRTAVALLMLIWALTTPLDVLPLVRSVAHLAAFRAIAGIIEILVGAGMISIYLAESGASLRRRRLPALDLFEQLPDIIITSRTDGQIISANAVACARLGFAHAEIVCLSMAELDASSPPALPAHLASTLATGESQLEMRLRRKDGSSLACELLSRPIGYDGGQACPHRRS